MRKSNLTYNSISIQRMTFCGFHPESIQISIKEHTYKYVREREILIPAHPPRIA